MEKTFQRPMSIRDTITATQESSGSITCTIVTTVPSAGTDDFLFVHQIKRAGVEIPGFKAAYSQTSGTLLVENAGSAALTSGDVLTILGTFYQ
jgi:hypothetical protein